MVLERICELKQNIDTTKKKCKEEVRMRRKHTGALLSVLSGSESSASAAQVSLCAIIDTMA